MDERRRMLTALTRRKLARESLERAWEELESDRISFAAWKSSRGLEVALSPDGVLESLAALQTAWNHLGALDRVNAKVEQLAGVIGAFQARLEKLTTRVRPTRWSTRVARRRSGRELGRAEHVARGGASSSRPRGVRCCVPQRTLRPSSSARSGSAARRCGCGPSLSQGRYSPGARNGRSYRGPVRRTRERTEILVRAHQDASNEIRALAGSGTIAELEQRRLTLEHDLEEVLRSWALLGCARLLLARTLRRHEQERQPAVLARAAERFAKVTEGRYLSLLPSLGEEAAHEAIRVISSSGAELEAASLSRGSIEQLYLCLRIGLAETFAERSEALPIILDDVLVNFDPLRAAAVAEVLAETSENHQVLFLTCHPHLTELVMRAAR